MLRKTKVEIKRSNKQLVDSWESGKKIREISSKGENLLQGTEKQERHKKLWNCGCTQRLKYTLRNEGTESTR